VSRARFPVITLPPFGIEAHVAPLSVESMIDPTTSVPTTVVLAASHPALVRVRLQITPGRTGVVV
jgi:hypothetical protein